MKDLKDAISKVVEYGLAHSVAQAFLIFSGVLVIVSVWQANNYVAISFFTLFYALTAHYLTALRKHESLGRYAVGSNHQQSILFTTIYISYFVWWATGVGVLLSIPFIFIPDKILLFNIWFQYVLIFIGIWAFTAPFIMTIIWLWRMFNNKKQVEKDFKDKYKARYSCKNCDFEGRVEILQRRPHWDHPCPECGLYELFKKECPHCAVISSKK